MQDPSATSGSGEGLLVVILRKKTRLDFSYGINGGVDVRVGMPRVRSLSERHISLEIFGQVIEVSALIRTLTFSRMQDKLLLRHMHEKYTS